MSAEVKATVKAIMSNVFNGTMHENTATDRIMELIKEREIWDNQTHCPCAACYEFRKDKEITRLTEREKVWKSRIAKLGDAILNHQKTCPLKNSYTERLWCRSAVDLIAQWLTEQEDKDGQRR